MSNHRHDTDALLFELISSDSEKAFEEIYNRYWASLYSNAFKRIKDPEAAREIVQDVFTELWIHRHDRKVHTSPGAYLHTAVRYRTLNQIQKEWVRSQYYAEVRLTPVAGQNSTEDAIFLKELSERLEKLISALPPQCRRIFELSRMEYKNNREIAAELNISEKTVENHLTKALRLLRQNLRNLVSVLLLLLLG